MTSAPEHPLDRDVGQHDFAGRTDDLRRGQAQAAGAAGQLEDAHTGLRLREIQDPRRHDRYRELIVQVG